LASRAFSSGFCNSIGIGIGIGLGLGLCLGICLLRSRRVVVVVIVRGRFT
jgi:hypothetical protein